MSLPIYWHTTWSKNTVPDSDRNIYLSCVFYIGIELMFAGRLPANDKFVTSLTAMPLSFYRVQFTNKNICEVSGNFDEYNIRFLFFWHTSIIQYHTEVVSSLSFSNYLTHTDLITFTTQTPNLTMFCLIGSVLCYEHNGKSTIIIFLFEKLETFNLFRC